MPRPDRRAVSLAASAVLRSLAGSAPVLLAVDDVQWIDAASAKVLSFAIRRLREETVGVLATLRVEPAISSERAGVDPNALLREVRLPHEDMPEWDSVVLDAKAFLGRIAT